MKLRDKIRQKLIKFLRIDLLQQLQQEFEIKTNKRLIETNEKFDRELRINRKDMRELNEECVAIHNTLKNIISVGADIVPHERGRNHSWAVICIEGDVNIVKFVDLSRQTAMDITRYLKQFEGGRMVVDTPYPQMFYEGFVFNKDFKKSLKG